MYDVLIVRDYEKNGEKKTAFNKIGVLFDNKNGDGWSGELFYPSARIIIKKSKPKDQQQNSSFDGDEVPF